jgi:hypothetical protein
MWVEPGHPTSGGIIARSRMYVGRGRDTSFCANKFSKVRNPPPCKGLQVGWPMILQGGSKFRRVPLPGTLKNILRDISVRITTEMPLSFGRCCVGEHPPECAHDSRFLDDFMEPAYRLHLGRRGTPLCFACYAGAPKASADPQPRTSYSVLADRTLKRWQNFLETPDGPLRRAETVPTPTTTPEARLPNTPPCNGRRASLRTRPNPALQVHEKTPTRHAKGIFTMGEIREAIIIDQHLARSTNAPPDLGPHMAVTPLKP